MRRLYLAGRGTALSPWFLESEDPYTIAIMHRLAADWTALIAAINIAFSTVRTYLRRPCAAGEVPGYSFVPLVPVLGMPRRQPPRLVDNVRPRYSSTSAGLYMHIEVDTQTRVHGSRAVIFLTSMICDGMLRACGAAPGREWGFIKRIP